MTEKDIWDIIYLTKKPSEDVELCNILAKSLYNQFEADLVKARIDELRRFKAWVLRNKEYHKEILERIDELKS